MNGKAFLLNEFQCFLLLQYIAEINRTFVI